MRLARGWAGVWRRAVWLSFAYPVTTGKVRVLSPQPVVPHDCRYLGSRRDQLKRFSKKPLCSNQQG
jgi:hypothetical protein